MANIMINSYCNLKCPYCFAEGEINSCDENNMSSEDFEKIIAWHKNNNIKTMRIIGGEPTIHPKFEEFMYRMFSDDFFEGIHIFSNMTFNDKVRSVILDVASEKKVTILPNFNDFSISKEKFEIIRNNVKIMSKFNIVDTIGVNIYKPDFDFKPLFDLAKETPVKNIRWAITTPNFKIKDGFNVKEHFNKYFNTLVRFFELCNENGFTSNQDCNSIPMCSFSDKQLKELLMLNPKLFAKELSCDVVLDINPKLETFRCFGMSSYFKGKLNPKTDRQVITDIIRIETEKFDKKLLFEECKTCSIYKYNGDRSCSCVLYRAEKGE